MISRLSSFFVRVAQRYLPDPYLFAIGLTFLTFILAMIFTTTPFIKMIGQWYEGLWSILTFAMQMILILVTGYTLAESRVIKRGLQQIASIPRNQGSAIVVIIIVSGIASLINWGFGLVVAALTAKEIAKKLEKVDFGFLVAGAYAGFIVWASGVSSSIALITATPHSAMNIVEKVTHRVIPLSSLVFTPWNAVGVILILITLPVVFRLMQPKEESIRSVDHSLFAAEESEAAQAAAAEKDQPRTPARLLENAWIINVIVFILGLVYLFGFGFGVDINKFIFFLFLAGVILHWTPIAYVRAFNRAARVTGPLILQYPLYGGIMGVMTGSGLAAVIAGWFVAFSTTKTLPFWAFISSNIISLFVPSGGGHWAVQGPIMVPAAARLGASQAMTAMGVAFGEQTANMIQPFWALPILAIARLGIRDIMGYCVMALILGIIIFGGVLLIWA